jgi:hypothetical protein
MECTSCPQGINLIQESSKPLPRGRETRRAGFRELFAHALYSITERADEAIWKPPITGLFPSVPDTQQD